MEDRLESIRSEYSEKIRSAESLTALDGLFLALFGKNGEVDKLSKEFPSLNTEQKRVVGPLFNQVKQNLERLISLRRHDLKETTYASLASESFNPEGSSITQRSGYLHPVAKFEQEIVELFGKLGFSQADAPHIDTDNNNFEMLNIPSHHPARDLWDTFYLAGSEDKKAGEKLLLRTHTSNSQIRILKGSMPPIRQMNLGRCYRYENVDARHEHTFEQFEIVYVDKGVNMANLQYLSEYFFKAVFGQDITARLRPKYYPFVEPGVGVDALCIFCKGRGCKICGHVGWLELAGAGMIHPTVLRNGGIDPSVYSGIAWGFGPGRMAMLKYGIEDLRSLNSGDLKFLQKDYR